MSEDILDALYAAIDEVNAQSTNGPLIEKSPETRLLGSDQGVDSLTFVNLIVAIEEQVLDKFGKPVVLVNEDTMGSRKHPFRTVQTLADYVAEVIDKQ